MKAAWGSGRWLSAVAVLLALLLGAVLAWEWEQGRQLERGLTKMRKLPATAVPAMKIQPEFRLPDMETGFPELLARPIFFASRRPMAVANQDAASAMKKGQFILTGVTILPTRRLVLLRDVMSNKTERVEEGKDIRGMQVEKITNGEVVLKQGEERESLVLKVQSSRVVQAPSPAQPAPAGPASAPAPASAPVPAPGSLDGSKAGTLAVPSPQAPIMPISQPKRTDPILPRFQWNVPSDLRGGR